MIKHPKRRWERGLNLAHRYFVFTSIAFTLVTTGFIGLRFYYHFKNRQPKLENKNPEDAEQMLEKFAGVDNVPKQIATSNFP